MQRRQIKTMEQYKIIGNISAGAHGVILKATTRSKDPNSRANGEELNGSHQLAIKRIFIRLTHQKQQREIPIQLIREIKCLQLLRDHDNIIPLLDVFAHGSSINLVFPLLPINLTTAIYEMQLTGRQKI